MSGRTQFSNSGRKLVDGAAFGRAYLHPVRDRPRLLVPSIKRNKSGRMSDLSTLQLHRVEAEENSNADDADGEEEGGGDEEDGDDDASGGEGGGDEEDNHAIEGEGGDEEEDEAEAAEA